MMLGRLGSDPGDVAAACYDPLRPSWMPYWLPTTDELRCDLGITKQTKAQAPAIPIQTPSASGAAQQAMMDSTNAQAAAPWSPEQAAAQGQTEWKAALDKNISDYYDQPTGSGYTPTAEGTSLAAGTWLLIAAAVVGGVLLLRR